MHFGSIFRENTFLQKQSANETWFLSDAWNRRTREWDRWKNGTILAFLMALAIGKWRTGTHRRGISWKILSDGLDETAQFFTASIWVCASRYIKISSHSEADTPSAGQFCYVSFSFSPKGVVIGFSSVILNLDKKLPILFLLTYPDLVFWIISFHS